MSRTTRRRFHPRPHRSDDTLLGGSSLAPQGVEASTPTPRAGRPQAGDFARVRRWASIPAPVAGRPWPTGSTRPPSGFNPRPPCGGRPSGGIITMTRQQFQSPPPARGATAFSQLHDGQGLPDRFFANRPLGLARNAGARPEGHPPIAPNPNPHQSFANPPTLSGSLGVRELDPPLVRRSGDPRGPWRAWSRDAPPSVASSFQGSRSERYPVQDR